MLLASRAARRRRLPYNRRDTFICIITHLAHLGVSPPPPPFIHSCTRVFANSQRSDGLVILGHHLIHCVCVCVCAAMAGFWGGLIGAGAWPPFFFCFLLCFLPSMPPSGYPELDCCMVQQSLFADPSCMHAAIMHCGLGKFSLACCDGMCLPLLLPRLCFAKLRNCHSHLRVEWSSQANERSAEGCRLYRVLSLACLYRSRGHAVLAACVRAPDSRWPCEGPVNSHTPLPRSHSPGLNTWHPLASTTKCQNTTAPHQPTPVAPSCVSVFWARVVQAHTLNLQG